MITFRSQRISSPGRDSVEQNTRNNSVSTPRIPLSSVSSDSIKLDENIKLNILEDDDPLFLCDKKKSDDELKELHNQPKKILRFYKSQNELIDELLAPIDEAETGAEDRKLSKVKIAIYISVCANVVLLCLQLSAAILSGSFSLFATTADAFMDLLSSAILLITCYMAGKKEIYHYPSGKGRFETVGIIVFGTLMATLSLQLIIHVLQTLFGTPERPDLGIISITFVAIALVTKFCLYIYWRTLYPDATAKVLALDDRNDLFVNSAGLILGILGEKVNPVIDPIGALLISLIILVSWSSTVLEHCQLVAGKCADPAFIKKLTYIAMTHDSRILQVDTCRAYHAGSKVIVEVDVVLPPETTLKVSHDLGESLQVKLESLPTVDRAFVHCDYESTHFPEHRKATD